MAPISSGYVELAIWSKLYAASIMEGSPGNIFYQHQTLDNIPINERVANDLVGVGVRVRLVICVVEVDVVVVLEVGIHGDPQQSALNGIGRDGQ